MDSTEKIPTRLIVLCIFLAAGIFLLDLSIPLGVAGGVPYIILVLASLWSPGHQYTLVMAITGSLLTILGFFFSPSGGEMWMVIFNRILALFAIWITAILSLRYKQVETARKFSRKLVESQENERKRIAAELHDSLGHNLLVIKNEIHRYVKSISENNEDIEPLKFASSIADEALNEIREIAYNLRPPLLDKLGLKNAILSDIKKIFNASEIAIHTEIDVENVKISPEIEINILRIIQEGTNNILKYSSASKASIKLKKIKEKIYLEISDNGKGFPNNSEKKQNALFKGLGLKGIEERTKMLGGSFQVDTKSGEYTVLKVVIPFIPK